MGPAYHSAPHAALRAVLLAAGCGLVYLLIAGGFRFDFRQSDHPHHVFVADALLHGQLYIRAEPRQRKLAQITREEDARIDEFCRATKQSLTPSERQALLHAQVANRTMVDWTEFQGRTYGYWAPLTPAVMVPFVACFGSGVSDRLINVLFGALNVGLFYWLLRRVDRIGLCRIDEACRVGLTVLLALGTSHFWMSCAGQVWFAVQIVTLTALLASLLAACAPASRAWHCLLVGVFFGCAILGRNIVALTGLFFVWLMWIRTREVGGRPRRSFVIRLALFCIPIVLAVGLQGAYNYARFGDVLESGLDIQIRTGGKEWLSERWQQHGGFSLHYLADNLKYYFWNCSFPRLGDGRIWFDSMGNSMFLVTPPLLYVFLIWRRWSAFAGALLAGVLPLLAALLLYFATGFVQFGPRYLLDMMPLLLLLVAIGMNGRLTHVGYVLIVLAVAAHLFGTYRFCDQQFTAIRAWVTYATLPALVAIALLARLPRSTPST